MRRIIIIGSVIGLMLSLFGIGISPTSAQTGDAEFFGDTGHWVEEPFLSTFNLLDYPVLVYGFPITDAFEDLVPGSTQGLLIQYFQKARFEYHPGNPPGQQVVITPLGEIFKKPGIEVVIPRTHPACRQALNWDFPVCYSFLDFIDANLAELVFGKPISHMETHGERVVQYFENARLEWHPDAPEGKIIQVANLGLEYFYTRGEDIRLIQPSEGNNPRLIVNKFYVHGFVDKAIIPMNAEQSIFVIVTNQNNIPVEGARVSIQIDHPSGNRVIISPVNTNELGLAIASYPLQETHIGSAIVTINIIFGEVTKTIQLGFRVWY